MTLQATTNPDVIFDTDDGAFIPRGNARWPEDESVIVPLPAPTVQEIIARFMPQLQSWMDGTAQQNGYDSVVSCVSYKDSGVAQWAQDAAAMIAWRDAVWQWAYQQQPTLDAMTPEQIAGLTQEYIISQAPEPNEFGWVVHAPGAPAV